MVKTCCIELPTTATVGDLFSRVGVKFCTKPKRLIYDNKEICNYSTTSCKTLKDVGIYHGTYLCLVVRTIGGGGYMVESFSSCDECLSEHSCQFTRLEQCAPDAISELIKKREDAYLILCQKFNFSTEVIRAIEDNSESNAVRLADVLHRIYHKDPSIMPEQIDGIVSQILDIL